MPGHHIHERRRRSLVEALDITVIGGGISGLAAAFTLANGGHRVSIYDEGDGSNKRCGASKIPPNGTLNLHRWGLKPLLDRHSQKFLKFMFRDGKQDQLLGTLLLNELLQNEAFAKQDVVEFAFMQDADLWDALHKLAVNCGVKFKPNSKVIHIEPSISTITLQSGERVVSDFIVGADGVHGIARATVTDRPVETTGERFLTLSCTVSREELLKDPDLASLSNENSWVVWAGEGIQLHGQLGNGYSITLSYRVPDNYVLQPGVELFKWHDDCTLDDFPFIDLSKFNTRPAKLVNLFRKVRTVANIHVAQPILENLVCDDNKVVLIGDAAHGMSPALHHNTALGLEDAEALGYLFGRIRSRIYVSKILLAYEEIRQPRIAYAVKVDVDQRNGVILPPGPERAERDANMKMTLAQSDLDHMDETLFYQIWGETLQMWLYDTVEKVDDWWAKWGSFVLREHLEASKAVPQPPKYHVETNYAEV